MSSAARVLENPFLVLGLAPSATRIEIEREAQKLLGMLELGFAEARTYATPLGEMERTPELVRAAVAALRDPTRRLMAELWARTEVGRGREHGDAGCGLEPWPDALRRLGWRA